jgi:hypothetical protein
MLVLGTWLQARLHCLNQSPSSPFKNSDKLVARVIITAATPSPEHQVASATLLSKIKVSMQ